MDPEDGGTGYYCTKCSFSGNSVELLKRINGYPTLMDTVQELRQNVMRYQLPSSVLTPAVIEQSIQSIDRRNKINAFWADCQKFFVNGMDPTWRYIANRLHVWQVGSNETRKLLSAYIGASSNSELEAHGYKSLGKGFKRFLLIPYYSAPGRISSFYCYPESTSIGPKWWAMFRLEDEIPDYGLFGLVGDALDETNLFVVPNPIMALQMLRDRFNRSSIPLPVSAYTEGTSIAYRNVGMNVVLWTNEQNEAFWKAVYLSKGKVASQPRMRIRGIPTPEDWYNFSRTRGQGSGPGTRIKQMLETAQPWTVALKDHLLKADFSWSLHLVSTLGLNTVDVNLLKGACEDEVERAKLSNILCQDTSTGIHLFNAKEYVIRADGIYRLCSGANEERVSNVRVIPHRIMIEPNKPSNRYISGAIKGQGYEIPFTSDYNAMLYRPIETIAGITVKEGVEYPYISPKFEKLFLGFCCSLVPKVEQVVGTSRVGWAQDEFIAPNFSIIRGDIVAKQNPILGDYVPLQLVEPTFELASGLVENWQTSEEAPVLLAIAAALLYNMLAPLYSTNKCGVGLVGKAADKVISAVAKELGLLSYKFDDEQRHKIGAHNQNERVKALELQHDLPIVVDSSARPTKAFRLWLANEDKNAIVSLSPLQSRFVTVANRWIIISPIEKSNLLVIRGFDQVLPIFIRHYQRLNGVLPSASTLVRAIVTELWNMFKQYRQPENDLMLQKALELIDDSSIQETIPLCDRALKAMFALMENGFLPRPHIDNVYSVRYPISYDQIADRIRIKKLVFVTAVKEAQLGFDYTDLDAITKSFSDQGVLIEDRMVGTEPSWVIPYTYWENQLSRYLHGDQLAKRKKRAPFNIIAAATHAEEFVSS